MKKSILPLSLFYLSVALLVNAHPITSDLATETHQSKMSGTPGQEKQSSTSSPEMAKPTFCEGEDKVWDSARDTDVVIKEDSNLTVMFHGNRFPASADLVEAFEKANPGIKVSYSSLPPISVIRKLDGKAMANAKDVGNISQKIALLDYPDVVMVPEVNIDKQMYSDHLLDPRIYSRIHGMIAVMRADENRLKSIDDLKKADIRFVLAGMQAQNAHLVYKAPEAFFGKELFDEIKKKPSTGYSQLTHHRSIPARILLGCEDVGFQFAQSQRYLEMRFPGKFKFLPLPESLPGIYESENSYIAITKNSKNKDAAARFRNFVLGHEGQAILAGYRLEIKK